MDSELIHSVEEIGNFDLMAESKLGEGALNLYQPENQMSESAPDDLHKLLLNSGTVIYEYYHR